MAPRPLMALTWLALLAGASAALALAGPRLGASLEKLPYAPRDQGGSRYFTVDFEGLFARHSLSSPRAPDELRVVYVGNSALARTHFWQAVDRAFREREPRARVYGLAWPGLNVSGHVQFVRRALGERPDVVVWAVSLIDCRRSPPLLASDDSMLRVRYGTGVGDAIANFRYATRDTAALIVHNLLGEVFPHVRHGPVLAEALPRLPRPAAPEPPREPAPPPARPPFPAGSFPPDVALEALAEMKPLVDASGARLWILVMPHAEPDAWFGAARFQEFVPRLRRWAEEGGAGFLDLSGLLPGSAFFDGVHFDRAEDDRVAARIAAAVLGS